MGDFYDSRYDNFDVTPLLENDRVLTSYARCFLDLGPCTAEGKDFKKQIPEALQTSCGRCTPKQKQLIRAVVKTLERQQPQAWEELINKFDPQKKYREPFNKFLNEQ